MVSFAIQYEKSLFMTIKTVCSYSQFILLFFAPFHILNVLCTMCLHHEPTPFKSPVPFQLINKNEDEFQSLSYKCYEFLHELIDWILLEWNFSIYFLVEIFIKKGAERTRGWDLPTRTDFEIVQSNKIPASLIFSISLTVISHIMQFHLKRFFKYFGAAFTFDKIFAIWFNIVAKILGRIFGRLLYAFCTQALQMETCSVSSEIFRHWTRQKKQAKRLYNYGRACCFN